MADRKPQEPAGLSGEEENALLAIEQAMEDMKAHGDELSQWRLMYIERAIKALDQGLHRTALGLVERAMTPADRIPESERAEAARLERRLEIEQLRAALASRRGPRPG